MAADLPTLQARLDSLKKALANGARSVGYGDKRVEYRDVDEIRKAITDVESDISALQGSVQVRRLRFIADKGL
jgi:hypothetical protein